MKIEWVPFERQDAAFELLVSAARIIDEQGSLPVAVTLARAGSQYFADRVRATGSESSLFVTARLMQTHGLGPVAAPSAWRWISGIVLGGSNAIKHGGGPDEEPVVELSYEMAAMLVMCGMGDARKLKLPLHQDLVGFANRQVTETARRLTADPNSRIHRPEFNTLISEVEGWVSRPET